MCLRLFVLPSKSATCHLAALFTIGYVDFYSSGLSLLCIMGIFGAWPPRQKCSVFCTKMRQLGRYQMGFLTLRTFAEILALMWIQQVKQEYEKVMWFETNLLKASNMCVSM